MRCPRCAADLVATAEVCAACGFVVERTHPIALPLREAAPAPRASAPRPSTRANVVTDVVLPAPALMFDDDAPGQATVNERPSAETGETHPSLEAIAAVPDRAREASTANVPALLRPGITTDQVPAVPRPEGNTDAVPALLRPAPSVVSEPTRAEGAAAVETTASAAAPLAVETGATQLKLAAVPVDSSETHLKLPEVSEPAPASRPAWPLVLLGSLATAALIIAGLVLFIPADEPMVATVEEVPLEPKPPAANAEPAAEAPATEGKEAPKASWGDPVARKAAFYPDEPSAPSAKRGVAPNRTPPPKGVLRVVTVAHGNEVSAPLSVDHQPMGLTPKELKGLKPGVHLFEVQVSEGVPVKVQYPVTAAPKQKNGDYLEIEIAQDGEVVARTPAPMVGHSGRSSDGVVPQRRGR